MDEGGVQLGSDDIIIPRGIGVGEGGGRLGRLEAILTAIKAAIASTEADIASMESTPVIPEVTPKLPVAADGTVTVAAGNAQDGDEITIGGITYTWKTALTDPAVPYEVLIGADNDAAAGNLKKAINKESTEGTNYGTGTVAHPTVSATVASNVVTVKAKTKGVVGNAIEWAFTPATEGTSNVTLAPEAALDGGVDGTPAPKGAVCFASGKIYVSVKESTVAESNWKSANLTTVT